MGSCPTPGNELSRETHELTKQKILLERCLAEPRRTALPPWLAVLGFTLIGLVSRLSLPNQSDRVLPGGTCIAQPRWMEARRILGGGQICGVSF